MGVTGVKWIATCHELHEFHEFLSLTEASVQIKRVGPLFVEFVKFVAKPSPGKWKLLLFTISFII